MADPVPHGFALQGRDLDYSDLTAVGRVTIEMGKDGVEITVDGFEFKNASSCRQHGCKALAWARDVLAADVAANRAVPGGRIVSITGMTQAKLEDERALAEDSPGT
ncbi:phage capsid protein [Burkholderia gladioli]|uniref:phage capsid protein n=1 Tax=Burkholderia gladioli TaxID=28095 RepID=UPI001FC82106|nr:phage capsid protein [Burkholderia gladioli]